MKGGFPLVTVVVPTRNEEGTIRACLEAVLGQDAPRDALEVLVIDGRSSDRTREIVQEFVARDERVRLIDNPARSVPAALNVALEAAGGDYLVRVDGHSVPKSDYVRRCVEGNVALAADLAGGWVKAVGRTAVGRCAAAAFASPFSMGNPGAWRRPAAPTEVASVPCGSYRIEKLREIGGFDEGQLANQDYEANYRLRRAGGRCVLLPDVDFRYVTRDTLRRLARQFVRYGFYKARTMVKHPQSIRARHLVPAAALLCLVALAVLSVVTEAAGWVLVAAVAVYAVGLVAASVLARRGLGREALLLPAVFATMHLAWGVGNVAGLARFVVARPARSSSGPCRRTGPPAEAGSPSPHG